MKKCIICQEDKIESSFHGRVPYCKLCKSQRPDEIDLYRKKQRKLDHTKNRDRDNLRNKQYYTQTKEDRKFYYHSNKEKFREYFSKSYYTESANFKMWLRNCQSRAKNYNLECSITEDYIQKLYDEQNGCCALTGIQFVFSKDDRFKMRPFTASIDRINSKIGYVEGNIRLVCNVVNLALNEFGLEIFDKMCKAYIDRNNK